MCVYLSYNAKLYSRAARERQDEFLQLKRRQDVRIVVAFLRAAFCLLFSSRARHRCPSAEEQVGAHGPAGVHLPAGRRPIFLCVSYTQLDSLRLTAEVCLHLDHCHFKCILYYTSIRVLVYFS